jgi:hypothetical protein
MRARAPITNPQRSDVIWSEDDDDTFNRTRDAITEALEELDLPEDPLEEETVKILRLPDAD